MNQKDQDLLLKLISESIADTMAVTEDSGDEALVMTANAERALKEVDGTLDMLKKLAKASFARKGPQGTEILVNMQKSLKPFLDKVMTTYKSIPDSKS